MCIKTHFYFYFKFFLPYMSGEINELLTETLNLDYIAKTIYIYT